MRQTPFQRCIQKQLLFVLPSPRKARYVWYLLRCDGRESSLYSFLPPFPAPRRKVALVGNYCLGNAQSYQNTVIGRGSSFFSTAVRIGELCGRSGRRVHSCELDRVDVCEISVDSIPYQNPVAQSNSHAFSSFKHPLELPFSLIEVAKE